LAEFYLYSGQGKTLKTAGWDFSIGGSSSTGTVRSVKPPQVRDRKPEVPVNQPASRKNLDSGSNWSSASGTVHYTSSEGFNQKDGGDVNIEKGDYSREDVLLCSL